MIDRRKFIKAGVAAGLASSVGFRHFVRDAYGEIAMPGLSNPWSQPKFAYTVPDALAPGFKFLANAAGEYKVKIREALHVSGLIDPVTGQQLVTPVWGYDDGNAKPSAPTWPGKTFEVQSVSAGGQPETQVTWLNKLQRRNAQHLLPVDTNLHWCYSLHKYDNYSIEKNGVPIITHLHGGKTDFQFDGNPEFFHSPGEFITGPQWDEVPGGFTNEFRYDNDVPAGNLWYHDHALGITRLNVYAGLAGFYFVRDEFDTGKPGNVLGLPAWPYEKAYAIQDRMFRETGELFYPAYPGDPFYEGFITDEGANLPDELFPGGGPTALAEFFGDHMVVNGVIWPKEDVEPRHYRLHLLNGTDSRFMVVQFRAVAAGATTLDDAGAPIPFYVVGSDQGLASEAMQVTKLVFEPGSRYDIVFDFKGLQGQRIIMENIGGDAPFGGFYGEDLGVEDFFPERATDRIMAFDVADISDINDAFIAESFGSPYATDMTPASVTRKVALFEGTDEFGRLQPLLGAEVGGEFRAIPWHEPTTETPVRGTTEEWEIYNFTGDAHPVHLHLVNFQVLGRDMLSFDEGATPQEIRQHNGEFGEAPSIENVKVGAQATPGEVPIPNGASDGYAELAPKDMVTALPNQVTRIKATFEKSGRYVWHCHILSHEDHEMMRVLQVQPSD